MSMKKRILFLCIIGIMSVGLSALIIVLMQVDSDLEKAAKASDTISINAKYCDVEKTLVASQSVEFTNRTARPKDVVMFHVFANAFREGALHPAVLPGEYQEAFPNGVSYGWIDIHTVRVNGARVLVQVMGEDMNVLIVPMFSPLVPGAKVYIEIAYTVKLANIAHRLGFTDRVVNLGNFYPVPVVYSKEEGWMVNPYSHNGDPFFNAVHNFNVTLSKPKNYVMASSGTLLNEKVSGDTRTTSVSSRAIRDWAAVLSPDFKVVSRIVDRVAVNYYFLEDDNAVHSLEVSVRALRTFSRLFVVYPYAQLTVVQTEFLHGGMEYGELVMISSCITDRAEIDRVIVHEIAHQWWYGIIGNDQVRTAWIDEGLTEYATLLFYDENPDLFSVGRADYINVFRNNFAMFTGLVLGVGGSLDVRMNRHLNEFGNQHEYFFMTYVRGMLLFVDLEKVLGRAVMVHALSNIARDFKFGIMTELSLISNLEKASGFTLGKFFQGYINGV